jgi:hypothetical protein
MAETVNQSNEGVVARISVLEEKVHALSILMVERFKSLDMAITATLNSTEKSLAAAITTQDRLTSGAFTAAKEALKEAQMQLIEYKHASNEWRETLTDLIAKGMLRPEIEALLRAERDRGDLMGNRITELEIARGEQAGKAAAYASVAGGIGIIAAVVGHFWH